MGNRTGGLLRKLLPAPREGLCKQESDFQAEKAVITLSCESLVSREPFSMILQQLALECPLPAVGTKSCFNTIILRRTGTLIPTPPDPVGSIVILRIDNSAHKTLPTGPITDGASHFQSSSSTLWTLQTPLALGPIGSTVSTKDIVFHRAPPFPFQLLRPFTHKSQHLSHAAFSTIALIMLTTTQTGSVSVLRPVGLSITCGSTVLAVETPTRSRSDFLLGWCAPHSPAPILALLARLSKHTSKEILPLVVSH